MTEPTDEQIEAKLAELERTIGEYSSALDVRRMAKTLTPSVMGSILLSLRFLIAERKRLKEENERLKEYEWMYKDLCK